MLFSCRHAVSDGVEVFSSFGCIRVINVVCFVYMCSEHRRLENCTWRIRDREDSVRFVVPETSTCCSVGERSILSLWSSKKKRWLPLLDRSTTIRVLLIPFRLGRPMSHTIITRDLEVSGGGAPEASRIALDQELDHDDGEGWTHVT